MAKKLSPITGQRDASRADNGLATQTALIFTAVMKEWGTAQTCGLPKPSRAHRLPRNAWVVLSASMPCSSIWCKK